MSDKLESLKLYFEQKNNTCKSLFEADMMQLIEDIENSPRYQKYPQLKDNAIADIIRKINEVDNDIEDLLNYKPK